MKNLKKNLMVTFLSMAALSSANAAETLSRQIEKIQINAYEEGKAYYFFYNSAGWGACHPSAGVYVRVTEGDSGSQAILSAALTAKTSGRTVKFAGTCFNDSTFDAKYMYLE